MLRFVYIVLLWFIRKNIMIIRHEESSYIESYFK